MRNKMKVFYVEFILNGEDKWTTVNARTENEARFKVYNGLLHLGYADITLCVED